MFSIKTLTLFGTTNRQTVFYDDYFLTVVVVVTKIVENLEIYKQIFLRIETLKEHSLAAFIKNTI